MAKQSAREKFMALVEASGWTLDPTALIPENRYSKEKVQDLYVWIKPATHGGRWRASFSFKVRTGSFSSPWKESNTLQDVEVWHLSGDEKVGYQPNIGKLYNSDRNSYSSASALYKALGPQEWVQKPPTVRERAELFVKDPDLAVWLAKEWEYQAQIERDARRVAQEQDRHDRARPLPVTVGQKGYDSDWSKLTARLTSAAKAVEKADGKSDLPALVAAVHGALSVVADALTDEASLEMAEHLGLGDPVNM